jgi:hypothetical protein
MHAAILELVRERDELVVVEAQRRGQLDDVGRRALFHACNQRLFGAQTEHLPRAEAKRDRWQRRADAHFGRSAPRLLTTHRFEYAPPRRMRTTDLSYTHRPNARRGNCVSEGSTVSIDECWRIDAR